jgi:hypothetical protein
MKLKLVHDGNPWNDRIVCVETGEEVDDVIGFCLDRRSVEDDPTLTIEIRIPRPSRERERAKD